MSDPAVTATLRTTLEQLKGAEEQTATLYRLAERLWRAGGLTDDIRSHIMRRANECYGAELILYRRIEAALVGLPYIGGAATASMYALEPRRPPELPPAQIVGGRVVARPPSVTSQQGVRGLGIIQAGPFIFPAWAALVLAALIVLGAAGTILGGIYIASTTYRDIVALREDTARYALELSAWIDRFDSCMAAGGGALACSLSAGARPTPPRAIPPLDPDPIAHSIGKFVLWGGLIAIVGTGGYFLLKHKPWR